MLAEAVRALRRRGIRVSALFAGRGGQQSAVTALLGDGACLGPLPQDDLPRLYASADLFVLPSATELCPNVVVEAKSSGLPVFVSAEGGSRQLVLEEGVDGFVVNGAQPIDWARALEPLALDRTAREAAGRAARASIERAAPSWRAVLEEDLLPVWLGLSPHDS